MPTQTKINALIEDSLYAMLKPLPCDFCGCRGLSFVEPDSQACYCLPCLERTVETYDEPDYADIDPAIIAIGQEIVRQMRAATDPPAEGIEILFSAACSECGTPGATWNNPGFGDQFCPDCLREYIAWEEAQLAQARAAFAQIVPYQRSHA